MHQCNCIVNISMMRRSSSIRSIHLAFLTDWGNLRSRWSQHPPQIHFQFINQSVAVLMDLICIGPFSRFRITNWPYHNSYRNIYCYSMVVRSPFFAYSYVPLQMFISFFFEWIILITFLDHSTLWRPLTNLTFKTFF